MQVIFEKRMRVSKGQIIDFVLPESFKIADELGLSKNLHWGDNQELDFGLIVFYLKKIANCDRGYWNLIWFANYNSVLILLAILKKKGNCVRAKIFIATTVLNGLYTWLDVCLIDFDSTRYWMGWVYENAHLTWIFRQLFMGSVGWHFLLELNLATSRQIIKFLFVLVFINSHNHSKLNELD
jgi:hypothetical protein